MSECTKYVHVIYIKILNNKSYYYDMLHICLLVDFDWSVANDFLVSVSSDGTCCLWAPSTGRCLRTIPDTSGVQTLCCRFHPTYANFVVVSVTTGGDLGLV